MSRSEDRVANDADRPPVGRSGATSRSQPRVVFTSQQTRRARDLLARFAAARRMAAFYPPGHAVVADAIDGLMEVISQYHAEGVDVPLSFFEHEVILGDQILVQESVLFGQLIRDMSSAGLNSVVFVRGLTRDELGRAMSLLSADEDAVSAAGGLEAATREMSAPNVRVGTIAPAEADGEGSEGFKGSPRESYGRALASIQEFGRAAAAGEVPSAAQLRDAALGILDSTLSNRDAMIELAGLRNHDEYTFFHSVNVAILSVALGSLVSEDRRFLGSLGIGALMHDIGKMTVDLSVLNKEGPLDHDEWSIMEKHPVYGVELAATLRGVDRSVMPVILEHHMRYDLDGYPRRQPPRRQHLMSRICAIADAYDAMTSRRSYSVGRLQDEAMEVLSKNAGTAFDPVLVRMFVQMMGVYPPRSVVRLSTGEIAIVLRPNADVLSPYVRVIASAAGDVVTAFDVDLSDPAEAGGRRVEACVDAEALGITVDDYMQSEERL